MATFRAWQDAWQDALSAAEAQGEGDCGWTAKAATDGRAAARADCAKGQRMKIQEKSVRIMCTALATRIWTQKQSTVFRVDRLR